MKRFCSAACSEILILLVTSILFLSLNMLPADENVFSAGYPDLLATGIAEEDPWHTADLNEIQAFLDDWGNFESLDVLSLHHLADDLAVQLAIQNLNIQQLDSVYRVH